MLYTRDYLVAMKVCGPLNVALESEPDALRCEFLFIHYGVDAFSLCGSRSE
jgi:hypothetical protein